MGRTLCFGVVVVVATMAVMAVSASPAAAATELCEVSTTPCPAGESYPSGSTFKVTGEFDLTHGVASCGVEYKFTTLAAFGSPLKAEVKSFSFNHCVGATPTALHIPWLLEIEVSTAPNGTSKLVDDLLGTPEFEVGSCTYKPTALIIPQKVTGGSTIGTASAVTMTSSGSCTTTELGMAGTPNPAFYVN